MRAFLHLALLVCCSLLFLAGCDASLNAIPGPAFVYDDFGTEAMASDLLGPKGKDTQVVARFGSTNSTPPPGGPDVRYVGVGQAMNHLRRSVRKLSRTPENEALNQRLAATYSRLYREYSSRRDAFMAVPSASYGRGGMNRALMMPPMPPSI